MKFRCCTAGIAFIMSIATPVHSKVLMQQNQAFTPVSLAMTLSLKNINKSDVSAENNSMPSASDPAIKELQDKKVIKFTALKGELIETVLRDWANKTGGEWQVNWFCSQEVRASKNILFTGVFSAAIEQLKYDSIDLPDSCMFRLFEEPKAIAVTDR